MVTYYTEGITVDSSEEGNQTVPSGGTESLFPSQRYDRYGPSAHSVSLLRGQVITGVSVTSDDNGLTAIHLLGERGVAVKIEPGDPGYLLISEYQGWKIPGRSGKNGDGKILGPASGSIPASPPDGAAGGGSKGSVPTGALPPSANAETGRGLPDDLARVLRDQSIIVPQDAAVFEMIGRHATAPSNTASADCALCRHPLHEPGQCSENVGTGYFGPVWCRCGADPS